MYGLINRSIQCFVTDTYGSNTWEDVARQAKLGFVDFESMLDYDDLLTDAVIEATATSLGRDQCAVLEDIGTYLVTHPHMEAIRRLLRFGGHNFEEFLLSLDDLHDRGKLAVPALELPHLELRQTSSASYALYCTGPRLGFGSVLMGILRALADDYGTLVLLDLNYGADAKGPIEVLQIELLEAAFTTGRTFCLGTQGSTP